MWGHEVGRHTGAGGRAGVWEAPGLGGEPGHGVVGASRVEVGGHARPLRTVQAHLLVLRAAIATAIALRDKRKGNTQSTQRMLGLPAEKHHSDYNRTLVPENW